ncbi:uncharacterized protein LOC106872157 [Octopus bimaculoides]|uniref:Uncharacterized protein n=1 Tax=Octopus bimaculoides TaxID=37653 RepID=A0A0L8H939_OCTBM|nr:uncharacterized protein LOC106872157 [Octopus bimaculoides]XP_052823012.1 uncharacterized protein LOC106872157 [Octopus bimaculoides]|eukprot:XP_014774525.1 PREDICTED: uncharacterized protein LOC106872157 [Octopus bimaculoides]
MRGMIKYWPQNTRLFILSNLMLVTMVLCLTALFLPYWFVVDFHYTKSNEPIKVYVPTKTPTTVVPTAQTTTNDSAPVIGRKKRSVERSWLHALLPTQIHLRYKRQLTKLGQTFNNLHVPAVNVGLFYLEYPYADFKTLTELKYKLISLVHLENTAPVLVVPKTLYVGQVLYSIGMFALTMCTVGIFILACQKYSSVTGEIASAGFVTFSALALLFGVAFAGIHTEGDIWDDFPVMNRVILNTAPYVTLNWGYYFALCGPLLCIFCCVLLWTQACSTCMIVEEIRRKQIAEIRSSVPYRPLEPSRSGHINTGMRRDPAPWPKKIVESDNEFAM